MIRVAVELPKEIIDPGEFIADIRALEAAGADSVLLHATTPDSWIVLGAIGALTDRIRLRVDAPEALQRVTGGRVVAEEPADEMWERVPMPSDRKEWVAMLQQKEAAGVTGIVLPWDARLIDLLRNQGEEDRSDLLMSTG